MKQMLVFIFINFFFLVLSFGPPRYESWFCPCPFSNFLVIPIYRIVQKSHPLLNQYDFFFSFRTFATSIYVYLNAIRAHFIESLCHPIGQDYYSQLSNPYNTYLVPSPRPCWVTYSDYPYCGFNHVIKSVDNCCCYQRDSKVMQIWL